MKTFQVTIEEHIAQTFSIEAMDLEDAMLQVEKNYKTGDLVVENGEVQTALIAGYDPETEQSTEWSEI